MSYRTYTSHEEYSNGQTSVRSTVIVHEMDDNESPDMLKVVRPTYEIESGVSEQEEYTDEDEDEDYPLEHWFPSLAHRSIIEFLDDDSDDDIYMMDHPFDMLTSDDAVIVEQGDDDDDDDENAEPGRDVEQQDEDEEEVEPAMISDDDKKRSSPRRRLRRHKRSKQQHADQVPVEVVHILL